MTAPAAPAPDPTASPTEALPPLPKRLILAALLQVGLAGLTGLFAVLVGYAASLSFAPAGPVWALAGPAGLLLLLAAILLLARHRWALIVTTLSAIYGVGLGLTTGALGIPLIIGHVLVGAIVWSVSDAFPEGPLLPVSRWGKALVAVVAVAVVVVGVPMLMEDPLKPSDTREPAWAGVVASAADRVLVDGRGFGQPASFLEGGPMDGGLLLGGGSVDAPTWAVGLAPNPSEPACFMTRDVGRDDGPAVVMLVSDSRSDPIGLRVAKAPGFHADPVTDGRYVGAVPRIRDTRLAVAGGPPSGPADRSWTPALAGYFCLDANGQVTRWDKGY